MIRRIHKTLLGQLSQSSTLVGTVRVYHSYRRNQKATSLAFAIGEMIIHWPTCNGGSLPCKRAKELCGLLDDHSSNLPTEIPASNVLCLRACSTLMLSVREVKTYRRGWQSYGSISAPSTRVIHGSRNTRCNRSEPSTTLFLMVPLRLQRPATTLLFGRR